MEYIVSSLRLTVAFISLRGSCRSRHWAPRQGEAMAAAAVAAPLPQAFLQGLDASGEGSVYEAPTANGRFTCHIGILWLAPGSIVWAFVVTDRH